MTPPIWLGIWRPSGGPDAVRAVSDTPPFRYLVLIGQREIMPKLFNAAIIPEEVRAEPANSRGPR
jgi:hypothetical protein